MEARSRVEIGEVTVRHMCAVCSGRALVPVLDLGSMPPANSFLARAGEARKEKRFPLSVCLCADCGLLQLRHVVHPRLLFSTYQYRTGASAPLVAHFRKLADEIVRRYIRGMKDLVVEVGSNDGSLLECFISVCRVLGVDPARKLSALARKKGVPTLTRFFNRETAEEILRNYGAARVILANNVLAHIDDVRGVFEGIRLLLHPEGRCIFEVHWVGNLVGEGGFDQVYHEHLFYYSLYSVNALLRATGLKILDAELVPVHGESLRVFAGTTGKMSARAAALLAREKKLGLSDARTYHALSERATAVKRALVSLLRALKRDGKRVAGYGAPAKGNTLLNYCGIGPETLLFLTDTTPAKQGTLAPGSHIRVVSPTVLKRDPPDYLLLLAWNYADAILEKEKKLRERGVKFIIPVPEVRIV